MNCNGVDSFDIKKRSKTKAPTGMEVRSFGRRDFLKAETKLQVFGHPGSESCGSANAGRNPGSYQGNPTTPSSAFLYIHFEMLQLRGVDIFTTIILIYFSN